jgi:hypothetical protein
MTDTSSETAGSFDLTELLVRQVSSLVAETANMWAECGGGGKEHALELEAYLYRWLAHDCEHKAKMAEEFKKLAAKRRA